MMIPAASQMPALTYVTAFADAGCHGRRADLLLRMPLIVMHDYRGPLLQTCRATGFTPGLEYIGIVADALWARRDPTGAFVGDVADRVSTAGAPLIELAEAWRPVTEADGTCRAIGESECAATRTARESCPSWRWK